MKSNIAIKVDNVSKDFKLYYDKAHTLKEKILFFSKKNKDKNDILHVLKNINLEIEKGESVALIGTNGSGKSTLLKLMTKLDKYAANSKSSRFGRIAAPLLKSAAFVCTSVGSYAIGAEIADKINFCMKNKDKVMKLYKKWKKNNDKNSKMSAEEFINDRIGD